MLLPPQLENMHVMFGLSPFSLQWLQLHVESLQVQV